MPVMIRPLAAEDLDALSRFLTAGFQAPHDASFAAPDVLRWKYLEPWGDVADAETPRSFLALDDAGAIVGHLGIALTALIGPGVSDPIPAFHMIDWLGSAEHRTVGVTLMRRSHKVAPVQFGLGGSDIGRAVGRRGGYQPLPAVVVSERIVNPWGLLRAGGSRHPRRFVRTVRDLGRRFLHPARRSTLALELERVESFGPETAEVVGKAARHAMIAIRTPGRLAYLMHHPRQTTTGCIFRDEKGRARGLALLNRIERPDGRALGRVADLLMDDDDPNAWHAASLRVSEEFQRQDADVVQAFGGPPWVVEGLRRAGFVSRHALEVQLRDRHAILPRHAPFYLTPIEADNAYG